jgi:hypothetical protein
MELIFKFRSISLQNPISQTLHYSDRMSLYIYLLIIITVTVIILFRFLRPTLGLANVAQDDFQFEIFLPLPPEC